MSTPYLTTEGVKVQHRDSNWYCGMCGHPFGYTYGFQARPCPVCKTFNRVDFSRDLVSERLALLVEKMFEDADRLDSIAMSNAACTLFDMIEEVRGLEKCERDLLSPIVTLAEPLPDPRLPGGQA